MTLVFHYASVCLKMQTLTKSNMLLEFSELLWRNMLDLCSGRQDILGKQELSKLAFDHIYYFNQSIHWNYITYDNIPSVVPQVGLGRMGCMQTLPLHCVR